MIGFGKYMLFIIENFISDESNERELLQNVEQEWQEIKVTRKLIRLFYEFDTGE